MLLDCCYWRFLVLLGIWSHGFGLLASASFGFFGMPDTKLYDILEIEKDASEADIKRAYRRLAREYHPDKNPDQQNGDMFKKISFAQQVLTDRRKREVYDREGLQGLRDGLTEGLFGEPSDTPGQQLHDIEEVLCGLLSEVARSLSMSFPEGGIQQLIRSAQRIATAISTRDYMTTVTETVKLSVQIYKAFPGNSLPPPDPDRNAR